jgi:hypothetical protein
MTDFSTPEGAILALEEAYRRKRIQPVRGPHLFLRRPRQRAKVGPAGRGAEYATQGGDRLRR